MMASEGLTMIQAAHVILYSREPEKLCAFFRDVLQFPAVDAGHGWLIFALPPGSWLCTRTTVPDGISCT